MTVTVRLSDGGMDKYMRFGDAYFKHGNGSLDVIRTGVKEPFSYPSGQWSEVQGDERKHKKSPFWR